jgi:hypothetical protein
MCLLGPLVDTFDYWDHMPQTGNDTEYTLVIVGLCVGALYSFARVALKISASSRSNVAGALDGFLPSISHGSLDLIAEALISVSPPPISALRI